MSRPSLLPTPTDLRSGSGLLERRFVPAGGATRRPELRATADDSSDIGFVGRALTYSSRTAIGDPLRWGFYEEIAPGAATDALATDDIRFLLNHDPSLLLARSNAGAGTMRLTDTGDGVDVDADMAPVSYATDLATSLRRGDIDGMSFHFVVREQRWDVIDVDVEIDGKQQSVPCELRTLVKIGLRDVAVVTYPAYDDTDAALRCEGTLRALADHRGLDDVGRSALLAGLPSDELARPAVTAAALEQRAMRHRGLAARYGLSR